MNNIIHYLPGRIRINQVRNILLINSPIKYTVLVDDQIAFKFIKRNIFYKKINVKLITKLVDKNKKKKL